MKCGWAASGAVTNQNIWRRLLANFTGAVLSPFVEFFSRNGRVRFIDLDAYRGL